MRHCYAQPGLCHLLYQLSSKPREIIASFHAQASPEGVSQPAAVLRRQSGGDSLNTLGGDFARPVLEQARAYVRGSPAFKHEATVADNVLLGLAEAADHQPQRAHEKAWKLLHLAVFPSSAAYSVSQYALGFCYLHGFGTDADAVQAASCFACAADKGFAPAQYALAFCLDRGLGVPARDAGCALELLRAAHEQGFQPAAQPLADLLAEVAQVGGNSAA
eukprot:jgi/Tetstr1/446072/TSEL_033673.t1